MTQTGTPIHQLYSRYILNRREREGTTGSQALALWGYIPLTMGEAARGIQGMMKNFYDSSGEIEYLKKSMKKNMRELGILTDGVEERIDRMHEGVVEVGNQPMCLMGPSLILNKIAYAVSLSEKAGVFPFFYVADYDGIQPELTNTRFPSASPKGLALSYPREHAKEGYPIYTLSKPSEEWLNNSLEKIENNYRGLLRGNEKLEKSLMNLHHAFSIIRQSYFSTDNVSEFYTKMICTLLNLEAGINVPAYWYSMPEGNQLFQLGYEKILSEPNRTKFIRKANDTTEIIKSLGYIPQIGLKYDDYVPFFLECPSCTNRVELHYVESIDSSTANVEGKCSTCGSEYAYSFNRLKPDLSDIINGISPRVDSRQFIVNSVIPVIAHICGPNEAAYFAGIIPAAKSMNIPFPFVVRYTRVFYNTPWSESLSTSLNEHGISTMASQDLFRSLGKWVKANKAGESQNLMQAHKEIQYTIGTTYKSLEETQRKLVSEIAVIKTQLRNNHDSLGLIRDIREKQKICNSISLCLSWAYGSYNPNKYGQELSWNWLDVAATTGIKDLLGIYLRMYNENTPNASMYYLNL